MMRASGLGCEPLAKIEAHWPKFSDPGQAFTGNEGCCSAYPNTLYYIVSRAWVLMTPWYDGDLFDNHLSTFWLSLLFLLPFKADVEFKGYLITSLPFLSCHFGLNDQLFILVHLCLILSCFLLAGWSVSLSCINFFQVNTCNEIIVPNHVDSI